MLYFKLDTIQWLPCKRKFRYFYFCHYNPPNQVRIEVVLAPDQPCEDILIDVGEPKLPAHELVAQCTIIRHWGKTGQRRYTRCIGNLWEGCLPLYHSVGYIQCGEKWDIYSGIYNVGYTRCVGNLWEGCLPGYIIVWAPVEVWIPKSRACQNLAKISSKFCWNSQFFYLSVVNSHANVLKILISKILWLSRILFESRTNEYPIYYVMVTSWFWIVLYIHRCWPLGDENCLASTNELGGNRAE